MGVGGGGSVSKTFKRQAESRKYEGKKWEEVIQGRSWGGGKLEAYYVQDEAVVELSWTLSLTSWACWPGSSVFAEEGTHLTPGVRSSLSEFGDAAGVKELSWP